MKLETERLFLRELNETDVQGMFELDSDPKVHTFLGSHQTIHKIEEAANIIKHVQLQYQQNGIGRWAVIEKESGEFMGWSGLKLEKGLPKYSPYYDLGYRFKPKFWGKGFATETAKFALQYGFLELNLPQINATAQDANIASNKVIEKVGFQFVETFPFEGITTNWYRLLKEEWLLTNK
jgi:ribosomal-protein-alanine N-acetyltransferase